MKTTQLDAVNEMLTAVQLMPVSSLNVATNSDVNIAIDVLSSVHREVETKGWWFNSNYRVAYAPSGGTIPIPSNVVSLRSARGNLVGPAESREVVERNGFLYDVGNNTSIFSTSVYLDTIISQAFEDLPESARRYITIRAARIFQTKILGDETLGVFTFSHEQEAWNILEEDHMRSRPTSNVFERRALARAALLRQDPQPPGNQGNQRRQR